MIDLEKTKLVLATLNAAVAAKSAKKDEGNEGHGPTAEETAKAYKTAAGHAAKAHKALADLHEHLSGMAKDKHEGAGDMAESAKDCAKSCKALSGKVHKAAGESMDDAGGDDKGEKALLGDALKALTAATETISKQGKAIEELERRAYQPQSAGAGARPTAVAAKGLGVVVQGAQEAHLDPSKMTDEEKDAARKSVYARTSQLRVPYDRFVNTPPEVLRAADNVLKLAEAESARAAA